MKYELVAGFETHIELATKTKIFCSCTTQFGSDPNTHCCPVCIGLPGALPRLNEQVVRFAIMAGLATNCEISEISKMDRKNYCYPDLPKAYQISQFDKPLCKNGYIELSSGKKIRINRIHIEEDAGKLIHKDGDTYVDYNRGGVPLIEIVTEPDFRSTDEAREYVEKLQQVMRYIGISDCRMQEGSMRCDVNISVRQEGSEVFGTRTEIKNMNSITFITKAMEYEYERQIKVIESGGEVVQETLRYDDVDVNHHINNAVYIALAEDNLFNNKKENIKISELSVDFKKSALLSDKQVNIKANFETNSADFTISNQDNTTDFARINMKF